MQALATAILDSWVAAERDAPFDPAAAARASALSDAYDVATEQGTTREILVAFLERHGLCDVVTSADHVDGGRARSTASRDQHSCVKR
jgi:hypothetical protein